MNSKLPEAPDNLIPDLLDFLRIPSVSTGDPDHASIREAADWLASWIRPHADEVTVLKTDGQPMVIGEMQAQTGTDAPTVLLYGHFDVQGPGDLDDWRTPPFDPVVSDGRIWGRGAADDKGNLLALCAAAADLHQQGVLPVNVRFAFEGDEEGGNSSAVPWLMADQRGADCAIAMDSSMVAVDQPTITLSCRGLVKAEVRVRTGAQDLHSGVYGGVAANAIHVLAQVLESVLPDESGALPQRLSSGVEAATSSEIDLWRTLPSAEESVREVGSTLPYDAKGFTFCELTGTRTAIEVNTIFGGDTDDFRMAIPETASARLSVRLAKGQQSADVAQQLESLLREATPRGATVTVDIQSRSEPAVFAPDLPAIRAASTAFEKVSGRPTQLIRQGGSLPIMRAFADRGIPAIISGFFLPDDAIHAPNESMTLRNLDLAFSCSRQLLLDLAGLNK